MHAIMLIGNGGKGLNGLNDMGVNVQERVATDSLGYLT